MKTYLKYIFLYIFTVSFFPFLICCLFLKFNNPDAAHRNIKPSTRIKLGR